MVLQDAEGRQFGFIEGITVAAGRLQIRGCTLARQVGLSGSVHDVRAEPEFPRPDVESALGLSNLRPGFVLEIPWTGGSAMFRVKYDETDHVYVLSAVMLRRLQFQAVAIDATYKIIYLIFSKIRKNFPFLKTIEGFLPTSHGEQVYRLNSDLFAKEEDDCKNAPHVTDRVGISIILPVFNSFETLPEVLERVKSNTDLTWRLIIVEDCSSDPGVRPWLRQWCGNVDRRNDRIILLENAENLGFIRSVNLALASTIPLNDHIVLLNSDALVPEGWASRLVEPMLRDPAVASVTPMSNDAEIFTTPLICKPVELVEGEADAIDSVARAFSSQHSSAEAPTGVGFCMAMNISFLKRLPELDTGFGRGYGEEVDWCQRARKLGGRHVGTARLFVEHKGGASFGSQEKLNLVQANNRIISRRYPAYDREVQQFIRTDPLLTPRLALALGWAGQRQKGLLPIYLAHSLGGGADMYLNQRIADDLKRDVAAVVLRVGGKLRWQIELHLAEGVITAATDDTSFMLQLLSLPPRRQVIYSCGVGDPDPPQLPGLLQNLADGPGNRLEVLIHDYFPLSPSYTLLGQDGSYHGLPDLLTSADPAHQFVGLDGRRFSLQEWRAAWGGLMATADRITVFSSSSRRLVTTAYPQASGRIILQPHILLESVPPVVRYAEMQGVPVIGILGNIGHHKGAAVLSAFSRDMGRTRKARLVVIGNVDPAYSLASPSKIHGTYRIAEIPDLVRRYGISAWFIPSIWPETFSYATHEALATGLPVFVFDLGAQAEAARSAPNGVVLPDFELETFLVKLHEVMGTEVEVREKHL